MEPNTVKFILKNKVNILSRSGFSMIEMVIALSVLSILSIVMFAVNQSIKSKISLTAQNIENNLYYQQAQKSFSLKSSCSCQLINKSFDLAAGNATIVLDRIKSSCEADAKDIFSTTPSDGAQVVKSITITKIQSTGNNQEYIGTVIVKPNDESAVAPIPILVRFSTDPSSPSHNKSIHDCGAVPISKPKNLHTEANDLSCRLTWDQSAGVGNIKYNVRRSLIQGNAKDGTSVAACLGSGRDCVVTGLINGTNYYFAVQSLNDFESTDFSQEVVCRPMQAVSTPLNVEVHPNSLSSCVITWSRPLQGTDPIQYKVMKSLDEHMASMEEVSTCNGASSSCAAIDLQTNTRYYFFVKAINDKPSSSSSVVQSCFIPHNACVVNGKALLSGESVKDYQDQCNYRLSYCQNGTLVTAGQARDINCH